jgi:hypothetical protein
MNVGSELKTVGDFEIGQGLRPSARQSVTTDVMLSGMRLKYFGPLAAFVFPTLFIGYGVVIPNSPIAGVNSLTIGFGTTVIGACLAYLAGIRMVITSPPAA